MTTPINPRWYHHKPVQSLHALAAALQMPIADIQRIASRVDSLYRLAKPIAKPDGSIRQSYDALPALKRIHQRIKDQFLARVDFPEYLTGSIKGRDARRNAALHKGAATLVCEDIEQFFPTTKAPLVHLIWTGCLGFSSDVAGLLTALTTKDGILPQGAITSSYLANLVFWDREPELHAKFSEMGISYSRYVDDISISSPTALSNEILTEGIRMIYGMLGSHGFKAKRRKHEIARGNRPMHVTKLMVNARPALPTAERQAVRAAVHQLEQRLAQLTAGDNTAELKAELNSVSGRVVRLAQFHPVKGRALKVRIGKLRELAKSK